MTRPLKKRGLGADQSSGVGVFAWEDTCEEAAPHERFRNTGEGPFFGALVYQRAVLPGHFLRQLRELVDWEGLTQEWVALYQGGAEYGPPPYHPTLVW